MIRRTKQRAYKAPKELYSRCRLAQSSSSACQTPGRSIVEGTKEYVTKRTWKNVFHEQFKKTHLLGIFWSILVVWNSECKYQLIITISWQELSALVYGHRAWHGASCEEEKREEFVHAA